MAIILRRGSVTIPTAVNIDLWSRTAEEIADWMIAADREKALEVYWALCARMPTMIFYFPSHGLVENRE